MMRWILSIAVVLATATAWPQNNPYAIVISGSGGEDSYTETFPQWAAELADVLARTPQFDPSRVVVLTETSELPDKVSTLEGIENAFAGAASMLKPADPIFVFLIGHGSYQRDSAKLNIPGPDLEATHLDELLKDLPSEIAVLVHTGSTSAAFINKLSGPGRIIVTATKSVEERHATQYMEQFILGIADGSADPDRDDRISVYEAAHQAAQLTEAWYLAEGFLATEHALIDDNGDGFGTRLILPEDAEVAEDAPEEASGIDGDFSSQVYIADYRFPPGVDPVLRAQYTAALKEIETLKSKKAEMETEAYYAELEQLLIKAARLNRSIHAAIEREAEADHE